MHKFLWQKALWRQPTCPPNSWCYPDICRHLIKFCPMNGEFQFNRTSIICLRTDAGIIAQVSRRKSCASTWMWGGDSLLPAHTLPAAEDGMYICKCFLNQKNPIPWHVEIIWNPKRGFIGTQQAHCCVSCVMASTASKCTADWKGVRRHG